jgi:hypothetical protein
MIDNWLQNGAQTGTTQTVFRESLAWTPRGLKVGQALAGAFSQSFTAAVHSVRLQ